MGAYLSKPVTDKELESGEDAFLSYASGSMQGWRTSQEDAHNCILDFSSDYSLFAVYDGHGGPEVAQLCSQKLPDHIKNSVDFINGNYNDSLTNSFLSFDEAILSPEMQEALKKLANIDDAKSEVEEEDDAALLQEEALAPLSEILKKYQMALKSSSDDEIEIENHEEDEQEEKVKRPESSDIVNNGVKSLKKVQEVTEEEEEDDDDEEFVVEDEEEIEDENDDENDEEDEEEEEENESEDSENNSCFPPFQYLRNAPGFDSGSTAVLSLINRKTLKVYVANVGDSRCVLCRNGEAVDLSIDHKPEDEIESQRIAKAGGILSEDGRVNGGLNLSRSLGDHSYKKNKEIEMKDQMISAFPDIQTIDLKPHEDEFLVLACDGIWNTFSSQQLVEFVSKRTPTMSATDIISEIFSHCLAPNTSGDGTGCDNMTCIIITFKFPSPISICNGKSNKRRAATKELDEESIPTAKLIKTQTEESVKI